MTSADSLFLIQRAREGDRSAWEALIQHYYPRWLKRFQGQVGRKLRAQCDTVDLVQSAMAEALQGMERLRNEGAFFAWVCAIIRRKISAKRKRGGKHGSIDLEEIQDLGGRPSSESSWTRSEEDYTRLLDAIIGLFPKYPEPMGAIYLRYFEKMDVATLGEFFGKAERSVHRLLESGRGILRSALGSP